VRELAEQYVDMGSITGGIQEKLCTKGFKIILRSKKLLSLFWRNNQDVLNFCSSALCFSKSKIYSGKYVVDEGTAALSSSNSVEFFRQS
jgi:hypothetical protein